MKGTVFSIQRFSLFDGRGVRTVVFLKGCPLRCVWCHNPEGMLRTPQVLYDPGRCIGCGECVHACPKHRHDIRGESHVFDRTDCTGCGQCASVCCSRALSMAGERMEVGAVMDAVARDLPVYRESGGGMTLSGGEPLYQPEFAIGLLAAAKELGIHTCVETCGQADPGKLTEAAGYTDVFYYDYKATGEEMHRRLCGVSQALILENLGRLDSLGAKVVLRCPIVPDCNDVPGHIRGIARTAARHACVREVQLEPYHRLGISKAAKLGVEGTFDTEPPGRPQMEDYSRQVEELSGKRCMAL